MRRENLKPIGPLRFNPRTTNSDHDSRVSPNLLKESANEPTAAGQTIVGDITYIRLADGSFCYLAMFQDKFTRRIVGWALSARMTVQLVIDAFQMARWRASFKRGAIIHTDRGSLIAQRLNFVACSIFTDFGSRCLQEATATIMPRLKVSFHDLRRS